MSSATSTSPLILPPEQELPADAHSLLRLLHSMGVECEDECIPILIDIFTWNARTAFTAIHDVKLYSEKEGEADAEDASVALTVLNSRHFSVAPIEALRPIAQKVNNEPLPLLSTMREAGSLSLPPERFRNTAPFWDVTTREEYESAQTKEVNNNNKVIVTMAESEREGEKSSKSNSVGGGVENKRRDEEMDIDTFIGGT